MNRIGIIGGTFNPVHTGHLIIADQFSDELKLDACYFIPCNLSPFKTEESSALNILTEHRVKMLELAIQSNNKFSVDKYEIEQGGVSYTFKTIKYLLEKFQGVELNLMLGSDTALSFKEWRNWEYILESVRLCVALRNNDKLKKSEIVNLLTYTNHSPMILNSPVIEISSTGIRERIEKKKSIKYLVPEKVEEYIYLNKLYE